MEWDLTLPLRKNLLLTIIVHLYYRSFRLVSSLQQLIHYLLLKVLVEMPKNMLLRPYQKMHYPALTQWMELYTNVNLYNEVGTHFWLPKGVHRTLLHRQHDNYGRQHDMNVLLYPTLY